MFALTHEGHIVSHYDKRRLVPFGEYVPFRRFIPFKKLTAGGSEFCIGHDGNLLSLGDGLPDVGGLLCYEAIFAELAAGASGDKRPALLLILTNDSWFGRSTGPYQHLHMARMRAVSRVCRWVRVANSGVSAIIDPLGKTLATLPLLTAGIIDGFIPSS